jgi:hypothetical protein
MRSIVLISLLAFAAIPTVALGQPPAAGKAGTDCTTQLTAIGAATFKATYAPHGSARSAMARCVARFTLIENQNVDNAAKACRTEQSQMAAADFAKKYNSNANGHNAFGKCVSTKAKRESRADVEATIGAAQACKAERRSADFASTHNGQSFAQFYGNGKANAFGKCVAAKAKAADQHNP